MARKLRIEYEGALYHVINRGNYRADIFASDGAREAFEECLWEACEKTGWRVHAYVIMRNHYHVALETPNGDLVAGMKWLQATFANRFNRFRKELGHVFQGRYQAIVLEDAYALGSVCHYIHLNPVRAKIVSPAQLEEFRWSSFHWINQALKRPPALSFETALDDAGGLDDSPEGRTRYLAYLDWLATDTAEQKARNFEKMSRGWAHGTKGFKIALIKDRKEVHIVGAAAEADSAEARELTWEGIVVRCLEVMGEAKTDLTGAKKATPWKVALANHLKLTTTASNPWIARRLHMGDPDGVSRYCAECRAGKRPEASALQAKIADIRV